jgi:hypothetical protein
MELGDMMFEEAQVGEVVGNTACTVSGFAVDHCCEIRLASATALVTLSMANLDSAGSQRIFCQNQAKCISIDCE